MYGDEVAEFDPKIVESHFVHLDTTLLVIVGAQANEDGIASLLAMAHCHSCVSKHEFSKIG